MPAGDAGAADDAVDPLPLPASGDAGEAEGTDEGADPAPVPAGATAEDDRLPEALDEEPVSGEPVTVCIVVRVDVEVGEDPAAGAAVVEAAEDAPGANTPPLADPEAPADPSLGAEAAAEVDALPPPIPMLSDAAEVDAGEEAADEAPPAAEDAPPDETPAPPEEAPAPPEEAPAPPPRQLPVHCPLLSAPEPVEPSLPELAAPEEAGAEPEDEPLEEESPLPPAQLAPVP